VKTAQPSISGGGGRTSTGAALGVAGYLTKPIERESLQRLVARFRSATPSSRVLPAEDEKEDNIRR
jgi:response regulator of citrate/malate metabolism